MRVAKLSAHTELLVFSVGERVLETLEAYAAAEHIKSATFSALGASRWLECGFYKLPERVYTFTTYEAPLEVVSLIGNLSLKEGKFFAHAHGVFSNERNETLGGHVKELVVGVTIELVLSRYEVALERAFDAETGLWLLNPH